MKKFYATMIFILMLTAQVGATAIDYGDSEIYSREDMDAAIEIIEECFGRWESCELHNIRYAGDSCNNASNVKWMNDLARGQKLEANFTQCIEFLSDFYVKDYGAFNPNSEYENWQWWLARSECGEWYLMTFGY